MNNALFVGASKYVKQSPCPVCRADLKGVTCTSIDTPKPDFTPSVGDFTICTHCGTILRFEITLRVRVATLEDLKEAQRVHPELFAMMQKMAAATVKIRRSARRKNYRSN
jgi:hypothetical protein